MIDPGLMARIFASAITLYMLLVVVRWAGAWLELDTQQGRLQWVGRVTDPPIELARKAIGQTMGPFDWAPIAVLFVCWIVRILIVGF